MFVVLLQRLISNDSETRNISITSRKMMITLGNRSLFAFLWQEKKETLAYKSIIIQELWGPEEGGNQNNNNHYFSIHEYYTNNYYQKIFFFILISILSIREN